MSASCCPPQIPIFPLPNVVLFPDVSLPLHIFEPRYRKMVRTRSRDRLIGMVLLRPGWEKDYEGRPPVYDVGCAGVISHHERMPDGRYNLVLQGMERLRLTGETHERSYRRAFIEALGDSAPAVRPRTAPRGAPPPGGAGRAHGRPFGQRAEDPGKRSPTPSS